MNSFGWIFLRCDGNVFKEKIMMRKVLILHVNKKLMVGFQMLKIIIMITQELRFGLLKIIHTSVVIVACFSEESS